MDSATQSLQDRVKTIGKTLWIFSILWLIFNIIALLLMVGTIVVLGVAGKSEYRNDIIEIFGPWEPIPGVTTEVIETIVSWDYDHFLETFWLTLTLAIAALVFFVVTMVLIIKVARAMKQGDILNESAIRSLHLLGWLYLIQGIVGQLWGMLGQFIAASKTAEVLYFSFVRDVSLFSFSFSGTGIEWGLLVIAISSILRHARLMRDEQLLVV